MESVAEDEPKLHMPLAGARVKRMQKIPTTSMLSRQHIIGRNADNKKKGEEVQNGKRLVLQDYEVEEESCRESQQDAQHSKNRQVHTAKV